MGIDIFAVKAGPWPPGVLSGASHGSQREAGKSLRRGRQGLGLPGRK